MQYLLDLLRYFAWVIVDGDVLNDWLGHLPSGMEPYLVEMGEALVQIFGG